MTRKFIPPDCDFCGKEATSGMKYALQISQRPEEYVKGEITKADNDLDMCHPCFLKSCKLGYKPNWTKIIKNEKGDWVPDPNQ